VRAKRTLVLRMHDCGEYGVEGVRGPERNAGNLADPGAEEGFTTRIPGSNGFVALREGTGAVFPRESPEDVDRGPS